VNSLQWPCITISKHGTWNNHSVPFAFLLPFIPCRPLSRVRSETQTSLQLDMGHLNYEYVTSHVIWWFCVTSARDCVQTQYDPLFDPHSISAFCTHGAARRRTYMLVLLLITLSPTHHGRSCRGSLSLLLLSVAAAAFSRSIALSRGSQGGLQSFGRQDVWAKKFLPNVHLGDTKLDVWATMTSRLGDESKSLHLGQPQSLGGSRHH